MCSSSPKPNVPHLRLKLRKRACLKSARKSERDYAKYTYSNEQNDQVRSNEGSKDTQIPPSMAEVITKRLVELVADFVGAVLASVGDIVDNISRGSAGEEIAHVRSTILAYKRY